MVTDIEPMEIITLVSIKLCPISLQIHSQLNQGFFCVQCKCHLSFWYWISQMQKTEKGEQVVGTRGRKPRDDDKNEAGKKKKKKKERRKNRGGNRMLPCVFWRSELLFEMKILSVWGITVDWQAHGSQAVICTPVIWSMVIITVCVCVYAEKCVSSIMKWWVAIQTDTQCGQSKKAFFFVWPHLLLHLYCQHPGMKYLKFWFFFFLPITLFILSSHWVTSFPSLPSFIHTFTASLLPFPFILASGAEKPAVTLHWSWEAVILGLCPTSD